MIHHDCGVANPKFRLFVCLLAGVVGTIAFQELSRLITAALNYRAAKLFGGAITATFNYNRK